MIWLTWRQFRVQALATIGALVLLAIYLIILGMRIRNSYGTEIVGCLPADCNNAQQNFIDSYGTQIGLIGGALIGLPAIVGIFWGAPLITRELENGTHRLVWNQSVTRTHWLVVKLTFIALITVALSGLFSLLLTWSASRYDQLDGNRFAALSFDSRNVVPIGYAVFAFVLGTVVGLVTRRTLPAMAITLAIFTTFQIVMPIAVRPYLMPAIKSTVQVTADVMERAQGSSVAKNEAAIKRYSLSGSWGRTARSQLLHADGTAATGAQLRNCSVDAGNKPGWKPGCLEAQDLHFTFSYQPASRYWPFQWIEFSIYTALTILLSGFAFWWIRNRPA